MLKYAKVIDETGKVIIGNGTNAEFYISQGFELLEVEKSEVDNMWYLADKCPHKSDEQLLQEAKEAKYAEALTKAKDFIDNEAVYQIDENSSIEATDGNIGKLTAYALGFQTGAFEEVQWTTKEDNVITLTAENLLPILMGLGTIQSAVWNIEYVNYKQQIEEAETIEEVEAIEINYGIPVSSEEVEEPTEETEERTE